MSEHSVVNNTDRHRYEVTIGDAVAFLDYARQGDRLVLVHTDVPDALEGHGVGSELVQFAIDDAQRNGYTVVPRCPFARGWLERHPDVAARVKIEQPA